MNPLFFVAVIKKDNILYSSCVVTNYQELMPFKFCLLNYINMNFVLLQFDVKDKTSESPLFECM
jgi:hypothetical protein